MFILTILAQILVLPAIALMLADTFGTIASRTDPI